MKATFTKSLFMNKFHELKYFKAYVRALRILVALVLLAPIIFYIHTFGLNISNNHSRWSEMGSAMSGLYTPILALLTLLVLVIQVRMQTEMNKLAFDQQYITEARDDIQYYIFQLSNEMLKKFNNFDSNATIQHELTSVFKYATIDDLQNSDYINAADKIRLSNPRVLANWTALYTIYAGLLQTDESIYTSNLSTAKSKTVALLSYESCVALDKLNWCLAQNKVITKYQFAKELNIAL